MSIFRNAMAVIVVVAFTLLSILDFKEGKFSTATLALIYAISNYIVFFIQ
jgi:hypothetical protein